MRTNSRLLCLRSSACQQGWLNAAAAFHRPGETNENHLSYWGHGVTAGSRRRHPSQRPGRTNPGSNRFKSSTNQLLVYNSSDKLIQTVATGGQGGVRGNAGGIAVGRNRLAVVNFGSQSVSIFECKKDGFRLKQIIPTASKPVSVAFGIDHLYILGTTKVESHQVFDFGVSTSSDGIAGLVVADGSPAQVGVVEDQLIITEKRNAIETVNLNSDDAVSGVATRFQAIPQNVNAPFGMVTRGNDAYVTIAHADEISLVERIE